MRAFILGNSGELLDHDLSLLQGEVVFGCNSLPLRCPEIIDHYVCLDIGMAFVPEVRSLVVSTCQKWYSRLMWNTIFHEEGVNVYDTYPDKLIGFEPSTTKVYGGLTVSYVMLQLAVALGYTEIYFLGVDLGLPANGILHIPEQETLLKIIRDKNLADPSTDKSIQNQTHLSFNKPVQMRFIYAKGELDKLGVKVFNLSKGGNLNCFPRKVYEEVLSNHDSGVYPEVELIKEN